MESLTGELPPLTINKKLSISHIFYEESSSPLSKTQSAVFLPFCQERDHLGRLIGSTQHHKCFSTSRIAHNQKDMAIMKQKNNDGVSDKVIESFFRKVDIESR